MVRALKVSKVLVSQPRPAIIEKSPFYELSRKHNVAIEYKPFIRVVGVSFPRTSYRSLMYFWMMEVFPTPDGPTTPIDMVRDIEWNGLQC